MKKFLFMATLLLSWLPFASIGAQNVAKIGSNEYATLQAAVNAAKDSGGEQTINLIGNVSGETVTIQEVANFKLTIDGKKDDSSNYIVDARIAVDGLRGNGGSNTNGASVTLQNIAFENSSSADGIQPQHYPHHLTIQDCAYTGSSTSSNKWFVNVTDGPLYGATIKNVTVENTRLIQGNLGLDVVFENIIATNNCTAGFNIKTEGTVLIKKCQITTAKYAFRDIVEEYVGTITLEDNTFVSTSEASDEGAIVNRGGKVGTGHINVVSGTYTGPVRVLNNKEGVLAISGGTFSEDPSANVVEGYSAVKTGDSEFIVVEGTPVARIGNDFYNTLEAAFAAATDGATITLLADCAGNGIQVPQGKYTTGLTVDFGNHTYTVDGATVGSAGTQTQAFQLLKDNKITFKNGTIYSEVAKMLVQNYSDLTLEGMTLTLNNANYASAYTLSNNNGNVVIDGTTINANPAGGFAFDVCRYASYPSVNVTVTGASEINGNIEISASGNDAKDGFGLALNGGTMTGNIILDASAAAAMKSTPEKVSITKADAFEAAAPENYQWVSNGSGTSTLQEIPDVAQFNGVNYKTLQAALDAAEAADPANIVIDLLADATLDITARANVLSIGTENTQSITINGNNHTLTFNQKNSDWNDVSTANDAVTKLILNDMTITNSGYNSGHWKRTNIFFSCNVEMNNVTSTALGFKNDATLNNVTIVDNRKDIYGIWIMTNGNNVTIDGLTLNTTGNGGRGIAIKDEDSQKIDGTSLEIENATFATEKKAAILVTSSYIVDINAGEGIDISNAAADTENLVWIDEKRATEYYKFTTTGASMIPEGGEAAYTACLIRGEQIRGYYTAIEPAISAAQADDIVKILKAGSYTLPNLPANITLEGAVDGVVFNHTTAGSVASVPNGATFKNVTFNFGNVDYHGFQHPGTINMEGCTLNGKLFSYGDMNFTNCQFNQSNSDYHMWTYAGNVTYTDCTFTNSATGKFLNVYNESGATKYTVTVNNCKFVNNASAANKAALNVKATCGSNLLAYDVIINNCTTEGNFPEAVGDTYNSDNTYIISPLVQVDDRSIYPDNITVKLDDVLVYPVTYVAAIGTKKYQTLEAAFAAAQNGETITLLADCTGNGIKAPQGKFATGLTVDFAGFTYTVDGSTVGSTGTETNGFQLLKDNKITFTNGTIYSEKAKILVQNYSDLTLEGMTLTLNNANYASAYTLSNNNGNVVIDGTTINANPAGGFAFDVCRYASYPSVNVEVKGESVINGNIEISASGNDAKDGFGLTLTAGTFNGNIVLDASAEAVLNATPEKAVIKKSNSLTSVAAPADYKWVDNGDDTSTLAPCVYVAQIGDVKYETLQAALDAAEAANPANIVIDLLADATLDITAWDGTKNPLSIGTENTQSITINGNNHTLTFNQKNSDWNNVATMNDAQTKLILNDINLTSSGYNNGPWNRHDINFNCAVELNNVTSDKAFAFKNAATLNNVTVTDTSGSLYGIWIQPNGQDVSINGLTLTAERGIKVDDQYLDNPALVNLDVKNATFNTTKKAAILVKSGANTVITVGENVNIENVAADKTNVVWVDEDRATEYYKVTTTGATMVPESKESDYTASLVRGEQTRGYYDTFAAAYASTDYAEGDTYKLHKNTTESVEVAKVLTIVKNGCTAANITAAEGFKKNETEEQITFVTFNPVCEIAGGEKYETLAEAVAAVPTDGTETTITLLDNVTESVATYGGRNIVLDLAEKTLTGYIDQYDSNVEVKNGTVAGTVYVNGGAEETDNYNKFTLDANATIVADYGVILYQAEGTTKGYGSTIDINGTVNGMVWVMGNITEGNSVININSGANIKGDVGVALNGLATLNVKDGATIEGAEVGIEARAGVLNVEGGTIKSTAETYSVNANGSGTTTKGAAIAVAQHTTKLPTNVTISGGTLEGVKTISVADPEGNNLKDVTVKVDDELLTDKVIIPEDFMWVSNEGISTLTEKPDVAVIGETGYKSLAKAVAAVPTDGTATTIKLLVDVTENVVTDGGKNIVLDLNGKTITGYIDQYDSDVEVKNGTVAGTVYVNGGPSTASEGYNHFTLANDATITSAWGFILYQGPNGNDAYGSVIDINGTVNGTAWVMGNITKGNSVINVNSGAKIEGEVFGLNGLATLNVKSGATIIGSETGIEVRAGNLNVEGGTITSTATEYTYNQNGSGTTTTGAAIAVAQHSTQLATNVQILGGTLTGLQTIAVIDSQENDLDGVTVTVADNLLTDKVIIPEEFMWESNGDNTSTLVLSSEQDIVLIDGEPYTYTKTTAVKSVTYKRTFNSNQINKYQSWYVPFDYTITAEDAEDFTFYRISLIANAPEAGTVTQTDKIWVYVTEMVVDDKLTANRPYVIIPKTAGEKIFKVEENAKIYAPNMESRLDCSTTHFTYDFYGSYDTTPLEPGFNFYYMSGGALSFPKNNTQNLGSYRWYIKATQRGDGGNYTPVFVFTEDDDDATGISQKDNVVTEESYYSLDGKRINKPARGTYIIKYSDGSVKKVAVK